MATGQRVRGQAQGLTGEGNTGAVRGRGSDPTGAVRGRVWRDGAARMWAGTRSDPTGAVDDGSARMRGRVWRRGSAYVGRHKACPYGGGEGDSVDDGSARTWAGTRPAPTGALRGRVWRRGCAYVGRHKACPYGGGEGNSSRRRGCAYVGRHKACPYGGGEGKSMAKGLRVRGQAQGLTLPEVEGWDGVGDA